MKNADPWPLAPGKATVEVEERFAELESEWPEPTAALRGLVTGILLRGVR